jgi:4-methylaminobutanoate oxidase (formaldehyde-forming)
VLRRQLEAGPPKRRLVQFRLQDADQCLFHEEPIWADGRIVGSITSGMHGHRIDASLGMGYVRQPGGVTRDWLAATAFELEIGWQRFPAEASLAPFYDPRNERIRP